MNDRPSSCAHCGSKQVRDFRGVEEFVRSLYRPDVFFVDHIVRRNMNAGGGPLVLPLLCESCQRYSMRCPHCSEQWPLTEPPRVWTRFACPQCGGRLVTSMLG